MVCNQIGKKMVVAVSKLSKEIGELTRSDVRLHTRHTTTVRREWKSLPSYHDTLGTFGTLWSPKENKGSR